MIGLNGTIFARPWATTENHENQLQALWTLGGIWLAAMGTALVAASLMGRFPGVSPTYGIAAMGLGLLAAYIGFKKPVPTSVSVLATRAVGLAAFCVVLASLAGFVALGGVPEIVALAGVGGVALYVGFFPH